MDFAYTPTSTWTWTSGRGWYEVAPGAAAVLGGLLLLFSANRAVASLGAWLGIAGGAWLNRPATGDVPRRWFDRYADGNQHPRHRAGTPLLLRRDRCGNPARRCGSRWAGCLSAASVTCEPHAPRGSCRREPGSRTYCRSACCAPRTCPGGDYRGTASGTGRAHGNGRPCGHRRARRYRRQPAAHHRRLHFTRRHHGEETEPTTHSSETQTQDH